GSLGTVLLYGAGGAVAGFFLPDVLLLNAGQKRQAKIRDALPDALDMLTVCVEAGLGFDAALAQVARNTRGPLAAEFARVLQETQLGTSRTQALRATAERTTVAELRTFVSALVQAGELGVPIGRVLREQAKGMRVRRRQRAEEQAQKVPVKILFPLVVCLFPAIFVVILGPGAISIMRSLF
ncbi:MAG: type II secretion system F family protein, partial [Saccharothrix sp.]|nr:type II secretion system F family protein [Saccharothrix sp.]